MIIAWICDDDFNEKNCGKTFFILNSKLFHSEKITNFEKDCQYFSPGFFGVILKLLSIVFVCFFSDFSDYVLLEFLQQRFVHYYTISVDRNKK